MSRAENPIIPSDFPDPDIIRVGNTYFMATTTMYFMPGCDILRSFDLLHWEFLCHVYDTLEDTPGHRLEGGSHIYGQGMWAPCLRYHCGTFYVVFSANDTHTTYVFRAADPAGPWKKGVLSGFYHDCSLLFDDDGRVYIVHGNTELRLTELAPDLSGPLEGGLNRILVRDRLDADLGYEGSHIYKRDGRYCLFTCHMAAGKKKTEDCFLAASLEDQFTGRCILDDDMGYRTLGVAQGGIVDTPEGRWYLFLFQDRGAVGRSPVLIPVEFDACGYPVLPGGRVSKSVLPVSGCQEHVYALLYGDDDFLYIPGPDGKVRLKSFWQFSHNPDLERWSVSERPGAFRIRSGAVCRTPLLARNTLTQRTWAPESEAWVTVDGSGLQEGDFAGICALQGTFGAVSLTRTQGQLFVVMIGRPARDDTVQADPGFLDPPREYARVPLDSCTAVLKVRVVFTDTEDTAEFSWSSKGSWVSIGIRQKLVFKLDCFTGCRFGLFLFSTQQPGGHADFLRFRYQGPEGCLSG